MAWMGEKRKAALMFGGGVGHHIPPQYTTDRPGSGDALSESAMLNGVSGTSRPENQKRDKLPQMMAELLAQRPELVEGVMVGQLSTFLR